MLERRGGVADGPGDGRRVPDDRGIFVKGGGYVRVSSREGLIGQRIRYRASVYFYRRNSIVHSMMSQSEATFTSRRKSQ